MMKKKDATTGFWEPGFSFFTDELAKEEKASIAPLKTELKEATDPAVKTEIKAQIAAIKTAFRTKRRSARYSLFSKA